MLRVTLISKVLVVLIALIVSELFIMFALLEVEKQLPWLTYHRWSEAVLMPYCWAL